jgi:hypothetical protein
MAAKVKKTKGKTLKGGVILRGSIPYMVLREIGELGDNGKKVMSIGFSGRIVANEKYPMTSLVAVLLKNIIHSCHYKDKAAAQEDIDGLKELIRRLEAK